MDPKRKKKIPTSVWLPALLLIYLFGMTLWFGQHLIQNGEIVRLISVFAAEIGIILLLRMFLIKREEQK